MMKRGDGRAILHASRRLALLLFAAIPLAVVAQNVDLVNATVVDGTGAAPRKGVAVTVRAGKITALSKRAPTATAGVRSIEHGTWVDDATLAEMKRRDRFFVPTPAVMSPLGDPHGNSGEDVALQLRTQSMMGPLRAAVRKARALGITIAAATDGSYADDDDTGRIRIAHEIATLREDIGMTPLESITRLR